MKKESNVENLKKEYSKLQKKYNLPSFEQLNKDFHIEKASESESEYIIREVRRLVADKIINYFRLVESILNPSNAPMFIFSIIKSLDESDKDLFREMYKKFARNEIDLIEIDMNYSEEKEAEYIKKSYETWKEMKKDMLSIVEKIKNNWDKKFEVNGRSYFG